MSERYINDMQAGDIVKLKSNFEEELLKLGFCWHYSHAVSETFKNNSGSLKIGYIRHEHDLDMDFAVFSPFFNVPVQCIELASGEDLLRKFKMNKRNELENPIQYIELIEKGEIK